jgi:hypothetical protein
MLSVFLTSRSFRFLLRMLFLGLMLGSCSVGPSQALPLSQDVLGPGSPERLLISFYRYEKSSPWWVNLGLPGQFFTPVLRLSEVPTVFSLRGVEYGVGVSSWLLPRLQVRGLLPFESNNFDDLESLPHSSVRPGDLKLGVSWLGLGNRFSRFRVAADGWVVFPTGVSPFEADFPILASGLGAIRVAGGLWASQRFGRFSFFQWINYEKATSVRFDRFDGVELPGSKLAWPDRVVAGARVDWRFFSRGAREATLSGELRVRRWGDWTVNSALWPEGGFVWAPADRIFDSGLSLKVKTDRYLTVEGRWSYYPVEFSYSVARPDFGQIITLVLGFHPFDEGKAR